MNAAPQTHRYELLTVSRRAVADTFRELADIAAIRTGRGGPAFVIRDTATGAFYDPALEPGAHGTFSVLAPPNRTPAVGERWLHRTLGEVEVIDTSSYRPAHAEWLVVRRLDGGDELRRTVDPADLIGRAE